MTTKHTDPAGHLLGKLFDWVDNHLDEIDRTLGLIMNIGLLVLFFLVFKMMWEATDVLAAIKFATVLILLSNEFITTREKK